MDFHENWYGHYAISSHPNFTAQFPTIINNNKMAGAHTVRQLKNQYHFIYSNKTIYDTSFKNVLLLLQYLTALAACKILHY